MSTIALDGVVELVKEFNMTYEIDHQFALNKIGKRVQVRDAANIAPKDMVDRYAVQIGYGGFPPIVVVENEDGSYGIVDGNTRKKAAEKNKMKVLPAIIITKVVNDADIVALGAALNNKNGKSLTKDEMVKAILRMDEGGYNPNKIEERIGCSNSLISRVLAERDTDTRLKKLLVGNPISAYPVLSPSQKKALGSKDAKMLMDEPYLQLAFLASDTNFSSVEINALRKDMVATGSEAKMLDLLKQARTNNTKRIADVKRTGNGTPPPSRKLNQHIGFINKNCAVAATYLETETSKVADYITELTKAIDFLTAIRDTQAIRNTNAVLAKAVPANA